jgi:hypothetical protein
MLARLEYHRIIQVGWTSLQAGTLLSFLHIQVPKIDTNEEHRHKLVDPFIAACKQNLGVNVDPQNIFNFH